MVSSPVRKQIISKYSCSFTVIMLDYPTKFLLNPLTNNMGHITITVHGNYCDEIIYNCALS